ncbi:unnamed protein product [Symbiodinium pilosum]|uniref:Secreted protein n=1 Tax=Symbiodinium pilosum TaxID=2952 RepID=A0A812TFP8_SYMPI|nr:unnamed protein product [Symbiodinium pilosum]
MPASTTAALGAMTAFLALLGHCCRNASSAGILPQPLARRLPTTLGRCWHPAQGTLPRYRQKRRIVAA